MKTFLIRALAGALVACVPATTTLLAQNGSSGPPLPPVPPLKSYSNNTTPPTLNPPIITPPPANTPIPTQTAPPPTSMPPGSATVPPSPSHDAPRYETHPTPGHIPPDVSGARRLRTTSPGYQPDNGIDPALYYTDVGTWGGRYPQPVGDPYYYSGSTGYGAHGAYGVGWNGHGGSDGYAYSGPAYGPGYGSGYGHGYGYGFGQGGGGGVYETHFGPGIYRSGEYGHQRFPYYSYRRPWYHPGPAVYTRDTNLHW